jgi:hypothetical protein
LPAFSQELASRSARPSPLTSSSLTSTPRESYFSSLPGTPAVDCAKNCVPDAVLMPLAEPYRTVTAPASVTPSRSSPGAPTTRSW